MRIDAIQSQIAPSSAITGPASTTGLGFSDMAKKAILKVNELQTEADQLATRLVAGDAIEIHQAMIAMQKASTALQFTVQVRNKVIEAYQEIMRIKV